MTGAISPTPEQMQERAEAGAPTGELNEALQWALDQLRFFAKHHHQPDDPFWNDYRWAEAVLENRDPDEDTGP